MVSKDLTNEVQKLEQEYQKYTSLFTIKSRAVVRDKADAAYQKANGKSFVSHAKDALQQSKWGQAMAKAATDQQELDRLHGTIRMLANTIASTTAENQVNKQINRRRRSLSGAVTHVLGRAGYTAGDEQNQDKLETVKGKVHFYDHVIYPDREIMVPSTQKVEPEDVVAALDYLNGHKGQEQFSAIRIMNAAAGKKLQPNVAGYLKGTIEGYKHLDDRNLNNIEHYVLKDADRLHIQYALRTVDASNVKGVSRAHNYDQDHNHPSQRLLSQKDSLLTAKELATSNPKTKISALTQNNPFMKNVVHKLSRSGQEIKTTGDVQKLLHENAVKNGFDKDLDKVVSVQRRKVERMQKRMQGSKKESSTEQKVDGGRQMGESRPGANLVKFGR